MGHGTAGKAKVPGSRCVWLERRTGVGKEGRWQWGTRGWPGKQAAKTIDCHAGAAGEEEEEMGEVEVKVEAEAEAEGRVQQDRAGRAT